jgi:uracil-DNA glycosylase family 4
MHEITMNWHELQQNVYRCTKCNEEGCNGIRCPDGRVPLTEPRNVKLLFISEAPPLNTHSYFYYEHVPDRLRHRLFGILGEIGYEIRSIKDFIDAGFYLLPTVKCPSAREGRNAAPRESVIKLCAAQHLKREIEYIRPDSICLLGRTALLGFLWLRTRWEVPEHAPHEVVKTVYEAAGKVLTVRILGKEVAVIPSYWPTRRHRRYHEIHDHIRRAMERKPY